MVLAFCGVMFNVLAGRMRAHAEEKFRIQVEQWERRQAAQQGRTRQSGNRAGEGRAGKQLRRIRKMSR